MRHRIDQGPKPPEGYDIDSLKYYKLNPLYIEGETSYLCYNDPRDFKSDITHMPDSTLIWTFGNNLVQESEHNYDSVFTVKGGPSYGWSYVKLKIETKTGFEWESSPKNFWTGVFNNTMVTGTAAVCPNSVYTYTAQVPGG